MSTLVAAVLASEFVPSPHLQFVVDGVSLDQLLAAANPEAHLNGLVPTTLGWLQSKAEQAEVWRRFRNMSVGRHVVPLLCCPDDLDFWGTVVVAEVSVTIDTVSWMQFGLDETPAKNLPQAIGSSVDWLPDVGPLVFRRDEYQSMIDAFSD